MRQQLRDISRVARIGCSALTVQIQVAIRWQGAPPKVGTPGDISPPIRPATALLTGCRGSAVAQDHILSAEPKSQVSGSTAAVHGIAPCPPGIYSSCQRSHRVLFGRAPESHMDSQPHRRPNGTPSVRFLQIDSRSVVRSSRTAGPKRKDNSGYGCPPRYRLRGGDEREARLHWTGTRPVRDGHLRPEIHTDDFSVDFQGLA